jgi:hypothetical protein
MLPGSSQSILGLHAQKESLLHYVAHGFRYLNDVHDRIPKLVPRRA